MSTPHQYSVPSIEDARRRRAERAREQEWPVCECCDRQRPPVRLMELQAYGLTFTVCEVCVWERLAPEWEPGA